MLRVILLLCLALASCQPATAVWPFNGGERSSSSNVDYTNSINSAISSLPSYISYVTSQQQPQLLNTEGELVSVTGQLGSTTEVKPSGGLSHGVKGVIRNPVRNKGTPQQSSQQLPQDFFSSQSTFDGYLEPVPANPTTGTLNLTDGKEKEGGIFRYIFPWRWIGSSNVPPVSADESSVQPPAPKRSWSWLLKSPLRKHSEQQPPSTNCFCFPANFQPPTVNQPSLYQTEQPLQPTQQQHQSKPQYFQLENSLDGTTNVRPVEPSPDFESDGSNHVPIVVPAPSQVVNGQQQQQQQQPQPQQVQQTQAVNGGTDLLANHRPQPSQQQQHQQTQQFVQQFQPVPVVTNYQTSPQQQQPAETGNQQTSSGQVASSN